MKKIAIVCAAGKQGKLLVDEAVLRGYDVTGFVRNGDKEINVKAKKVVKDLFDLTREDLTAFDVVIDAFGAWTPETLPLHRTSLKHLCDVLKGTDTRLLVVGGAGSLYVDMEHTLQVKDLPDFPDIYKPLANMQGEALNDLRQRNDVKWTFLSPAGNFVADGERTGKYILGGEEYFVNEKGISEISYADYAIAMIDEIENANNIQKRFSVIGE
ncbi:MAG: NAD(P)-dependent oxidoreductase [Candidatus Coproplasma sp.]